MKEKTTNHLIRNMFQTLVLGSVFIFLVWYLQYLWNRRRLYVIASKYPGPVSLPFIGNALLFAGSTNDTLNTVLWIIKNYGSLTRAWLGPNLYILITAPEDLQIILNSSHCLEKDELYKYLKPILGTGLLTAPASKWKRHRKVIMPTFNQHILDDFVTVFSEQSIVLLDKLKNMVGKGSFDIFDYLSRWSLDIVCETSMGVRVEAQTKNSNFHNWIERISDIVFNRMVKIWFHFDFIFNLSSYANEFKDNISKVLKFTGSVIREKREIYQKKIKDQKDLPEDYINQDIPKKKAFLQQLIELSEQGANFTDEELREEVNTFITAGSETTASTNSFVFIMLGMFPEIQEKVYQEVLEVLGPDRPVQCTDLEKLQYTERVQKETMRLFPCGPLILRAVTQDIKLEKCIVPAGSSVVLAIIGLHWDEKIWPNPLKFDPDRFLPEEVTKRHPYSWLTFSGGRRNCVGFNFALMTMKVLTATVIRKYKLSTEYKNVSDVKLKQEVLLKPVNGHKVSIELRE